MVKQIYLDYNASTPVSPEVKRSMIPFFDEGYGNPSATHFAGTVGKEALENARKQVASLLNASSEEIIFVSGGSEANNHVLKGSVHHAETTTPHIITTVIEHPAILEPCRFLEKQGVNVTYLGVNEEGMVAPEAVEAAITKDTVLISVMHANNETGAIQPIEKISEIAKKANIPFHTDASQSTGKIPTNVDELGVDFLTVAGHKLYAPNGVGALYMRKGTEMEPLLHGAGHELGRRAGTENVIFAVGLGKACEMAKSVQPEESKRLETLRDQFMDELEVAFEGQLSHNSPQENVLPNTLNINIHGFVGEELLTGTPQLAASTGSACHAGDVALSPVLKAMGVSEERGKGALRLSIGRYTTKAEITEAVRLLKQTADRISM
ncbi:cysteine desulfurase family protein [Salsuginibacillus kocurii]|uniref:cysteine desulfurase family protein n=1 Tax=Salsuginibacillus kocurii TaxID=427078 RepID=UPI00036583E9|nr:cysteine desulfurase family protein [Salsuginibacillus kocurii]